MKITLPLSIFPSIGIFLISILLTLSSNAQNKSIGGVFEPEDNVIWLRAHDLSGLYNNSKPISYWPDSSYYSNNAVEYFPEETPPGKPTYRSKSSNPALFNGLPVVRFSSSALVIPDADNLDGMEEMTIISVLRSTRDNLQGNGRDPIIGKWEYLYEWNVNPYSWHFGFLRPRTPLFSVNKFSESFHKNFVVESNKVYIQSASFSGPQRNMFLFTNGQQLHSAENLEYNRINRNIGTDVYLGYIRNYDNGGRKEYFIGELGEILVFNKALNPAERLVIENVLARKYNVDLGPFDFLSDFPANFDNDIIGIGTTDGNLYKHSQNLGSGGSLYLQEHFNSLSQANEFFFAGHNGIQHSIINSPADVPAGVLDRWQRVWYINRSTAQGTGSTIRVGFDFIEAGISTGLQNGVLYTLLYKENESDDFQDIGVYAGASGGRVTFILPDMSFQTGFFTIGRTAQPFTTWISERSGNLSNPGTWVNNINPVNIQPYDNVIIKNTHRVTIDTDNAFISDLTIDAGGVLVVNETRGHTFLTLRGQGDMEIMGDYFPNGNASIFNSAGGGTVVWKGSENYLFSNPRQFNNLRIELSSGSNQAILAANYHISGNLTVVRGTLMINDDSPVARIIRIDGNLTVGNTVGADATILTGTGDALGGNRLIVRGNIVVNGLARFSNLTDYNYSSWPTDGYTHVVFNNPSKDQFVTINGRTEFYRIEVEKGFDDTYKLEIAATAPDLFFLYGRNNINQNIAPPNRENFNALGLLAGKLVLGNNIRIPRVWTGNNRLFDIDSDAHLVLDGASIGPESESFTEETNEFRIWGGLTIKENSYFRTTCSQGLVLVGSGQITIEGGEVFADGLRTSTYFGTHRGSFMQSGGEVTIKSSRNQDWVDNEKSYYRFSLAYPENFFGMTGGILNIYPIRNRPDASAKNGGIYIGSNPDFINVTGGIVNFIINTNSDFYYNSTAPFHNLNMKRISASGGRFVGKTYVGPNDVPFLELQPLMINNLLTIEGGAIPAKLDLTENILILEKDMVLASGAELFGSNSEIVASGTNSGKFEIYQSGYVPQISKLTISKDNLQSSTGFSILRINPGNSTMITIADSLKVLSGYLDFPSNTYVSLLGALVINDSIGRKFYSGTLLLNGTSSQTIETGTSVASSYIANLEIDNSNGVNLIKAPLSLVNHLKLTSGIFNIGVFNLKINHLSGSDFNVSKMIATSGVNSDGGLQRLISTNGVWEFPIGSVTTTQTRYTPVTANIGSINISDSLYLRINPVASELTTLSGNETDQALKHYWRIRFTILSGNPIVNSYNFVYHPDDLPADINDFVPGKVVGTSRFFEAESNFIPANNTIRFNNNLTPFNLEEGFYTAGKPGKFSGVIRTFYSRGSNNIQSPADWNASGTWSEVSHSGIVSVNIPGPGDLVEVGFSSPANPHTIKVSTDIKVAGINFNNQDDNLPRIIIENNNIDVQMGAVTGAGAIALKLGENVVSLTGDLGDFLFIPESQIIYQADSGKIYHIPDNIRQFPTFVLEGSAGENSADIYFPNADFMISGDLQIKDNVRAWLSDTESGDITIQGNLEIGYGLDSFGKLIYPASSHQRKLNVGENLVISGEESSGIDVENQSSLAAHKLLIAGSILQENGKINLYSGSNENTNVSLELSGITNGYYQRNGGSIPYLYNVIMKKGTNLTPEFTFNDDFFLNYPTNQNVKPIELVSGTLILASENTSLLISSGGGDFTIPSTSGLVLRGSTFRINGNGTGIELNGLLRLENGAQLFLHESNSTAHIGYGSSGTARLEIFDEDTQLLVGSQIRGPKATENDNGILKYLQTNGSVVVGYNAITEPKRAVLEVHNPGSSFQFTGGSITIIRGSALETDRSALFLFPEISNVSTNATIRLGNDFSDNEIIRIQSNSPIPNLIIDGKITGRIHASPLRIDGSLTIETSGVFESNDQSIFLGGDMLVENNGFFVPGQSDFHFNGISQTITGVTRFFNLFINSSNQTQLNDSIPTSVVVFNNLSLKSGVLRDNGNYIDLQGDLYISANHESAEESGGLRLSGSSDSQNIWQGNESTTNRSVGNLIINNPNNIILNTSLSVTNRLLFVNGIFDINNNLLELGFNSEITTNNGDFSSFRMIRTNGQISDAGIRRVTNGTGIFIFPVGVGAKYTPLEVEISQNPSLNPSLLIVPVNEKHPNLSSAELTGGNLRYYWKVEASSFSNLNANFNFRYHGDDVEPNEADYIAARLYDDSWQKLDATAVDEGNHRILFPHLSGNDLNLSGFYTAGSDIPDRVLWFATRNNGLWTSVDTWENITPLDNTAPVPPGGPIGQIVVIRPSHTVNTGSVRRISYKTTVNGRLKIDPLASGKHFLGITDGSGIIELQDPYFPSGSFNGFMVGGTIEYGGTNDYTMDFSNIPTSGVNNIVFKGSGIRSFPINTILRVNGDLSILGNVSLNLAGDNRFIEIKGDLINQSILSNSFSSGFGVSSVRFVGTTPQAIIGQFTEANRFNLLEINNHAGVEILGQIEVGQGVNIKNGKIVTTFPGTILRMLNGAEISGTNFNRYIEGPLQLERSGSLPIMFPVGNSTRVSRIGFNPSVSLPAGTILEARYYDEAPPQGGLQEPDLEGISAVEYWSLLPVDNLKSGNLIGTVDLYIEDSGFSGITMPEDMEIAWLDIDVDPNIWRPMGGTSLSNNQYIRSNIFNLMENNGYFSFGSVNNNFGSNPLPVELLIFDASLEGDKVRINWSTASETNNDYFTVERSSDGLNFEIINYYQGAGNSNQTINYNLFDENPLKGISYYRLKQTDYDGSFQYSELVAINYTGTLEFEMSVYPNPALNGVVNVRIINSDPMEAFIISITDMKGNVILTDQLESITNGEAFKTISGVSGISPGIYLLTLQGKSQFYVKRLIVR